MGKYIHSENMVRNTLSLITQVAQIVGRSLGNCGNQWEIVTWRGIKDPTEVSNFLGFVGPTKNNFVGPDMQFIVVPLLVRCGDLTEFLSKLQCMSLNNATEFCSSYCHPCTAINLL